jgi:type IV secretory pathway TrbD component
LRRLEVKIASYILGAVLLVVGTVAILQGLGAVNIITSVHRLRYLLGGVVVDLVAIALFVYAARRK